jgi:hypothetical protein
MARAARSVDRVARDRIGPGWMSRALPRSRLQTEAGKSGASMKNQLLLPGLCLSFAIGISGQTQAQNVPMVITSDYYAQPKTLVLHALTVKQLIRKLQHPPCERIAAVRTRIRGRRNL